MYLYFSTLKGEYIQSVKFNDPYRRCAGKSSESGRVKYSDPRLLSHKLILNATLYLFHGKSTTQSNESVVQRPVKSVDDRKVIERMCIHFRKLGYAHIRQNYKWYASATPW